MKPDIVHLNNINFQLTPSVMDACAAQGVPMVQTVHDYQMLCPNHLFFDLAGARPCERCLHGSAWNCASRKCIHGSRLKSVLGAVEGALYRRRKNYEKVAVYIAPSRFMAQKLMEKPVYQKKTETLHNFIEITAPREAQKKEYVLYFGRLSAEKGLELFLAACRRLPGIRFIVAGAGPQERLCQGIPNVEYIGFQSGEALQRLIAEALFSVYPSVWYENCPLSVLESEALGTPVLGSRMGGIPELIEHGETGHLLRELTADCMAESIEALYNDRPLLAKMSRACLAKRAEMVTLPAYTQKILGIYRRVIEK